MNGLEHIPMVWDSILLETNISREVVDLTTVQRLEGLAPFYSKTDRQDVIAAMGSNQIFRMVVDERDRDILLKNILSVKSLIPSLYTFVEDLKWLEVCCKPLKNILGSSFKGSIRQSFYSCCRPRERLELEAAEGLWKNCAVSSEAQDKWVRYAQVWATCLREFPNLQTKLPRKELGKDIRKNKGPDTAIENIVASKALRLGFETLSTTACRDVVRTVSSFSAAPYGRPAFTSLSILPKKRRSGRPYEADYVRDRDHIFLPQLLAGPAESDTDIGSFFVTWNRFTIFIVGREQIVSFPTHTR